MERICEKRVAEGLPALAIRWGAIGDVGLIGDKPEENKDRIVCGTLQQSIVSCLNALNEFLLQSRPIVGSFVLAEKKAGGPINILNSILNIMGKYSFDSLNR